MRKVFLVTILICIIFCACKTKTDNTSNTGVDNSDTLSKIQSILKANAFTSVDNFYIHACGFDGIKMFKYTFNDLRDGYLRQVRSDAGEYRIEINGAVYITMNKGNKNVMYKLVKYNNGKYGLVGDISYIQADSVKEGAKPDDNATKEVVPAPTTTNETIQPVASAINDEVKIETVLVDKTFFYKEADLNTIRKGYLIKGQRVTITKKSGQFVYCIYGKTEGWMLASDVQ